MPRCGCSDRCTCKLVDGCGIHWTGDGNLATRTPYRGDLLIGTEDACACVQVMDCVGSNLAENGSLVYTPDDHELQVCLSQQEGNLLRIGTDGCLFYDGSEPPPVDPCHRTIDTLPPFAAGGMGGAGYNGHPWNNVHSYSEAVDADLDLTQLHPFVLADGTVVISPYDGFGEPDLGKPDRAWYTEPPVYWPSSGKPALHQVPYHRLTGPAWRSCRYDYAYWEPFGRVNTASWFQTFEDVLDATGGRIVYAISIDGSHLDTDDVRERLRSRVVDMLLGRCLTRSAVIYSRDPARLAEPQAAGFETGVYIDANNIGTVTPQVAVAAGAKWAFTVNGPRQSTRIVSWTATKTYADAGLRTVSYAITNRLEKDKAADAGCQGFLGHDPIYQRDDPERYGAARKDTWLFQAIPPGQQAWRSVNFAHYGTYTAHGVRTTKDVDDYADGRMFRDGNTTTNKNEYTSFLLGQFAPLPVDANGVTRYFAEWKMKFVGTPAADKYLGLLFACPTDIPALERKAGQDPLSPSWPDAFSGYLGRFLGSGEIQLLKIVNGKQTDLTPKVKGDPPVTAKGHYDVFRLVMTGSGFAFQRLDEAGNTVQQEVKSADVDFRGHYLHIVKHDWTVTAALSAFTITT